MFKMLIIIQLYRLIHSLCNCFQLFNVFRVLQLLFIEVKASTEFKLSAITHLLSDVSRAQIHCHCTLSLPDSAEIFRHTYKILQKVSTLVLKKIVDGSL